MPPIDGKTKILGVLGEKIDYTLSPIIQNAALAEFGINCRYLALPVEPGQLSTMVKAIRILEMPGVNVTIPHKERIGKLLDEITPIAERLGAVNTVIRKDSKLVGDNTDYAGFEELYMRGGHERYDSAIVLGAGGAARAVLAVLADKKVGKISVACRKKKAGNAVIRALDMGDVASAIPWDGRNDVRAELVVNATPMGQHSGDRLPVSAAVVKDAKAVLDLVSLRPQTKLVALARSYDVNAHEGTIMLIAQGRESFYRWFGKRPSFEIMERALRG